MSNIFEKFNKEFGGKDVAKEVEEIKENGGTGEREEVPYGTYEVALEKMDLVQTKNAPYRPMLSVWFKIVDGKRKGQLIFMNQLVDQAFKIHIANEFMKALDTEVEVTYDGYFNHYHDMILDVFAASKKAKLSYQLNYGENNKGFKEYKIEDVFEN